MKEQVQEVLEETSPLHPTGRRRCGIGERRRRSGQSSPPWSLW